MSAAAGWVAEAAPARPPGGGVAWPRPRRGIVVLLLAAVVIFAPYRHFTTDDAFIHLRFARNLAHGRGFSYNPGEPTYGDTAPLWVGLVAALGSGLHAAGAGTDTDVWRLAAKLLDAAAVVACLLLFARLARRLLPAPRWGAAAVTALFLLDPWFIKWSLAGMETPLALALVLGAWRLRERRRRGGRIDPWTPLVLGAGYLVRPELALVAVALIADVAIGDRRHRRLNLGLALLVPVLIVVPWLVGARLYFGSALPNTLAARRDINYSALYVLGKLAKILLSAYAVPLAGVLALLAARRGRRARLRRDLFPLLATLLVLGFYMAWRVSVGARYVLLVSPMLALVGYAAWIELLAGHPRRRLLLLGLAAATLLGVQGFAVRFVTRWPQGLDAPLFEVADWLRTETPPGTVVAAHEIGVIGYVSQRRILDLAALVSPEVPPFSHTGSVARSLGARAADYLVWNANQQPDARLLADMRGRLQPLLVRRVHREGSSHLGGWQYYTVYRVRR